MDIIEEKIAKFKMLQGGLILDLCRAEESIHGRQKAIKSLPVNAERPKLVAEANDDIDAKKRDIEQIEKHIDNINELLEQYEKLLKQQH